MPCVDAFKLRQIRYSRSLTQVEVYEKAGISRGTYIGMENPNQFHVTRSPVSVTSVAGALDVEVSEFTLPYVEAPMGPMVTGPMVTVKIDREFHSWGPADEAALLAHFERRGIGRVRIVDRYSGCVALVLEVSTSVARRLADALNSGALEEVRALSLASATEPHGDGSDLSCGRAAGLVYQLVIGGLERRFVERIEAQAPVDEIGGTGRESRLRRGGSPATAQHEARDRSRPGSRGGGRPRGATMRAAEHWKMLWELGAVYSEWRHGERPGQRPRGPMAPEAHAREWLAGAFFLSDFVDEYAEADNWPVAITMGYLSLAMFEAEGSLRCISLACGRLAQLHRQCAESAHEEGESEGELAHIRHALVLGRRARSGWERLGDPRAAALEWKGMGDMYALHGDRARAKRCWQRARALPAGRGLLK